MRRKMPITCPKCQAVFQETLDEKNGLKACTICGYDFLNSNEDGPTEGSMEFSKILEEKQKDSNEEMEIHTIGDFDNYQDFEKEMDNIAHFPSPKNPPNNVSELPGSRLQNSPENQFGQQSFANTDYKKPETENIPEALPLETEDKSLQSFGESFKIIALNPNILSKIMVKPWKITESLLFAVMAGFLVAVLDFMSFEQSIEQMSQLFSKKLGMDVSKILSEYSPQNLKWAGLAFSPVMILLNTIVFSFITDISIKVVGGQGDLKNTIRATAWLSFAGSIISLIPVIGPIFSFFWRMGVGLYFYLVFLPLNYKISMTQLIFSGFVFMFLLLMVLFLIGAFISLLFFM